MFENIDNPESSGDSMPELNIDSFMDIPAFFNEGLTPEQIRHRSQLYQVAYEKARQTLSRKSADNLWMKENGLTLGDGI